MGTSDTRGRTPIKTRGIVLHTMPVGENDKRLVLFTKDTGKTVAFAKGAQKAKSPLLSSTQVFAYSDLELVEGRQSHTLAGAVLLEPFYGLRKDLDRLAYGLHLLEHTGYLLEEGQENQELLYLLLKTLKHVELSKTPLRQLKLVYEVKSMEYTGIAPLITQCVLCGRTSDLAWFHTGEGGALCRACAPSKGREALPMEEPVRHLLQHVLSAGVRELFSFQAEEAVLDGLERIVDSWLQRHLSRRPRSLEMLKRL
ncbi:DNA repair protein RecO [Anaerotalea alkaliphila]|uniref:DNA repair protein RecO n=1 Tax=Anaerotalea alkaliphila TaxID=2662126 RepID=A0A7X5HVS1_9FIRM|nr:DNA repair protein RecO [Anaerotalea alkaliphila]NDL67346.1 DNA repair protein RecO [Anaerotalea alkaliphila]